MDMEVEIAPVYSFPNEGANYFLDFITQTEFLSEEEILICDQPSSQLLLISLTGEYLGQIGETGNGPGEFYNPLGISIHNGKILIIDQNNRQIQVFNSTGQFSYSFKTLEALSAIVANDDSIFGNVNYPVVETDKLITEFSYTGKVKRRFGTRLYIEKKLSPKTSASFIRLKDDTIHILFKYYPVIKSYEITSNYEKTIELDYSTYGERVPENYRWSKITSDKRSLPLKYLFKGFKVTSKGYYLGLMDKDLIIDHVSLEGELLKRYICRQPDERDFYLFDILIDDKGELPKFIVTCRKNDEGIVEIYKPLSGGL